nr:unnamed protein product [Haemonchus contortus]
MVPVRAVDTCADKVRGYAGCSNNDAIRSSVYDFLPDVREGYAPDGVNAADCGTSTRDYVLPDAVYAAVMVCVYVFPLPAACASRTLPYVALADYVAPAVARVAVVARECCPHNLACGEAFQGFRCVKTICV